MKKVYFHWYRIFKIMNSPINKNLGLNKEYMTTKINKIEYKIRKNHKIIT